MVELGKLLLVLGVVVIAVGVLLMVAGRFHLPLGHLPGDIVIRGKHSTFYFPLGTCIVVSVVLSVIFWLLSRVSR